MKCTTEYVSQQHGSLVILPYLMKMKTSSNIDSWQNQHSSVLQYIMYNEAHQVLITRATRYAPQQDSSLVVFLHKEKQRSAQTLIHTRINMLQLCSDSVKLNSPSLSHLHCRIHLTAARFLSCPPVRIETKTSTRIIVSWQNKHVSVLQ